MFYLRFIIILFLCNYSSNSYGQLADFNLSVAVSDEICTNNGKLDMLVSGTTANATIVYRLYIAPDFLTSIAETTSISFTSLAAGSYRIVATQALGGFANIATADVVIDDLIEDLDFVLFDVGGADCSLTASIVVDVLEGNPVLYEILSGPVIRPVQSSNVFADLPSGAYIIRVFDTCNDALSKAYTFDLGSNTVSISAPELPNIYTSCTSLEIQNQIATDSNALLYPLVVNYTVFAPDGTVDQNYSQTVATGPADLLQLTQQINLFGGQLFTVKIEITDNCNNMTTEEFEINMNPKLSFLKFQNSCGLPYFSITIKNYLPPYTLNFTTPSEFIPFTFNADYPGPFTTSTVVFGDGENTVPFGEYSFSAEDACGRIAILDFLLVKKPIVPNIIAANAGCDSNFGNIQISIPNGGKIISILITEAPAAYQGTLPQNVFSLVEASGAYIGANLPVGDYVFFVIDDCENEIIVEVTIPEFVFGELTAETRPSCSSIFGAVKLFTANGPLTNVSITAAPATYPQTLPNNVSANINSDGNFYMTDLSTGTYTFNTVDICGFTDQITVAIAGYNSSSTGFSILRKCGAFDITLNDTDTSITGKTFWLQKFFPETNTWGNPNTGAAYTEGAIPNSTTARPLLNPATLLNIFLTGDFRILKVFSTFNNGSSNGQCLDLYAEFIVSPELLISGVYNLNCIGGSGINDVVIDALGVEPVSFTITEPFFLDNGTNNVFTGLQQGIYNILTTDNCGNIKNISIEIGTLLPLVRATAPDSLLECRDDGLQFGTFSLVNQTPQVLGSQQASRYVVTYHLTQSDVDADINPLPDGYTNISNPQTIYARVEHKYIKLCYATTLFEITVGNVPVLTPTSSVFICDGFTKKLTADNGFAVYEWSTGETTQSIIVNQPGTYTVTVKNVYNSFSCDASKDFIVTNSGPPTIIDIATSDWSPTNNSAVINFTGIGTYLYSLDNVNFQTSNAFNNLLPGFYTAYVKDENGCGKASEDFVLLNYPKYFTPNGDGYNDTWHIRFSTFEPNLNVDIFDRFGRFLIRLKGGDSGWDGTYNGQDVLSTDYWFVVTRDDGKIYKGHFSLKR
jgi:gliding motility-associated-like protein